MALISCVECKHQVSDKAATCPQCGAPITASLAKVASNVAKHFRDPRSDKTVDLDNAATYTLLFGTFYFLVRGIYSHALISAVLAMMTFGISWLIYPCFARSIVRNDLMTKGWVAIA